jgi:Bacterial protein of unknown function (DUF937)
MNNLVSLAMQYLTPDVVNRIASALGIDKSVIGKAATAAVPGLLGMFANAASRPDGAGKLADSVGQQSAGILDSLASTIAGPGQQSLANSGISSLRSLLGNAAAPALAGALSKFTGMGQGSSSSLIGMLAPVVLGTLGDQQAEHGLDASGMARLLASQKDNISAALPPGFGSLLSAAGVPGFAAADNQTPRMAQADTSFPDWLKWILGALALAVLAWWLFGKRPAEIVEPTTPPPAQVTQNLTVDGVDLRSTIQTTLDGLKTTLQGVSDAASAKAALPNLEASASQLDKVRELAGKLPVDGKTALAALVTAARPSIEQLLEKVLAIPGVDAVAKPTIDAIRAKLDALSKA